MNKIVLSSAVALLLFTSGVLYANTTAPVPKTMHPSWDVNKDGLNDCEDDGSCDDSVDYSLPRGADVVSYTENFYKAVNREWLATHEVSPQSGKVSNFEIIIEDVNQDLKKLLEALEKSDKLTVDEQKILDLYRSFSNVEYRNKLGMTPLNKGLETIRSAKTHDDIAMLFSKLGNEGVNTPLTIAPEIDKKDSTRYMLLMLQSGVSLERDVYLGKGDKEIQKLKYYREYLVDALTMAKLDNVQKRVDDLIKLETEIAKIQWSILQLKEASTSYNIAKFDKANSILSNLNLGRYFETRSIKKDIDIDMMQEEYLKTFNALFVKIDVEQWKAYLEAKYVDSYGEFTVPAFSDLNFEYRKKLGEVSEKSPDWKKNLGMVNRMLGMSLGKLYVESEFDVKSKQKTKEIIGAIVAQYREKITNSTLFSKETKAGALKKLDNMAFNIGYPDKWQDYTALKIDKKDLIGNFARYIAYANARSFAKMNKPVDHSEWGMTPQTINAFYTPPFNKFIILAAILNKPFFDINASDAKNYGAIGMVIAHEIGHSFDDKGSRYDYQGNMLDWWTKEDRAKYNKRAEALISQANHFEYLPKQYLNGKLEIGEIIGDLNGVTMALAAYEKIIKEKGLDRKASLKEFFIQLAKVWRNKTEPHLLEHIVHIDPHPVSEFRVNGILKNIDTFHEVFETKEGDGMYMAPEKRVKLW
ncbi:MAG: M13 family metallopeptidase [Thermodesulfobacteriota bacterium]|nr:M13 family metallopeptidase [Thermodesulfobacteriota bacterium]